MAPARRHRADHRALVADDRVRQPELVREDDRRARHAPGRDRDAHAARDGLADRRGRRGGDPEVVRRSRSRRGRARCSRTGNGRRRAGSPARQAVHASAGGRARSRRRQVDPHEPAGDPPGPASRCSAHPGSGPRPPRTIASPWSAPISSSATPPISVTAAAGRSAGARRRGRRARRRARSVGSNAISGDSRASSSVGTYGRFAHDRRRTAARRRYGQQVRGDEHHPVGHAVTDRVLARQLQGLGRHVDRDDQHLLVHLPAAQGREQRDGDRARSPCRRPTTRSAGAPWGRGVAASRAVTSASAASTSSSVSGRGISARESVANASPWNSRKPRM